MDSETKFFFQVLYETISPIDDSQLTKEVDKNDQASNKIQLNSECILKMSKKENEFFKKHDKEKCKILTFQVETWTFDEIIAFIESLNSFEYPHLFVFAFKIKQWNSISDEELKLKIALRKFSVTRPLVAQILSEENNQLTIIYSEENSTEFQKIDQSRTNYEKVNNFPSFLFFLTKEDEIEDQILDNFENIQDLSLILRYFLTCTLSDEFMGSLVLECAKYGSVNDFLSCIDASFDSCSLNQKAQEFVSFEFEDDEPDNINEDNVNENANEEKVLDKDGLIETKSLKEENQNSTSVLLVAIESENKKLSEYLISHCSHLIQELPFEHKVRVSTAACKLNLLDMLCDLLEISDFPFPENFNVNDFSHHERLTKMVKERMDFELDIKEKDEKKILIYVGKNLNLKYLFNVSNKSAMYQAIEEKRYDVYYFLYSLGLQASEFQVLEQVLNIKELKEARKFAILQRRENVKKSLADENNSINLLCMQSFIHNRKIAKDQERTYRKKIREWYEDIYRIPYGPEFLTAVSSCEQLKIIFDFESYDVDHVSLSNPNSVGTTYPVNKWIFIGAKSNGEAREQEIKGVIAHELCHCLMHIVYENQEKPFYKHDRLKAETFLSIVNNIDKWSSVYSDGPDDECKGIISSVYKLYHKDDCVAELIVRVIQILAQFHYDEQKLQHLEDKYKILFDYWENFVMQDIRNFNLKSRQNVRNLNDGIGLLKHVSSQEIELMSNRKIKCFEFDTPVVITTNVPCLLLANIYNNLKFMYENLLDARNIFVDPEKLNNSLLKMFYEEALEQDKSLRVIIDGSNGIDEEVLKFVFRKSSKLTIIVSDSIDAEKIFKTIGVYEPTVYDDPQNYYWVDLDEESKKRVLRQKIDFQNNSSFSFLELLTCEDKSYIELHLPTNGNGEIISEEPSIANQSPEIMIPEKLALEKFSKIVDCQVLNLLLKKEPVIINARACIYYCHNDESTKHFDQLYQPRKLVKKQNQDNESSDDEDDEPVESKPYVVITQDKLLSEVENKKFIIISDIAGTGKSWMMKFVAKTMLERTPKKWTTYVDLKEFIEDFKMQKDDISFECFMVSKILKPEQQFEGKFFNQLYKDGKVCILFDGYDEIPEACVDFVTKLIKSFEHNSGNQMWISTRDHFEFNLQESLGLDEVYRFEELSHKTGINLIVTAWILNDYDLQNSDLHVLTEKEIKNDKNYKPYQTLAKNLLKRFGNMKHKSVGYPDFCKFIANYFKNDKSPSEDVTAHSVYEKLGEYQSKRSAPRETATGKNFKF